MESRPGTANSMWGKGLGGKFHVSRDPSGRSPAVSVIHMELTTWLGDTFCSSKGLSPKNRVLPLTSMDIGPYGL